MIATLLIIENQQRMNDWLFNDLLLKMPKNIQQDILKYQRWQDKQATLLGKCLLIKGLEILKKEVSAIHTLQKDNYKRLFFKELKTELDFNISHSEGIVVCALCPIKVGVDVERIEKINPDEYRSVFTPQEFKNIIVNQDKMVAFFKNWTRKEAIMKADGRGFYLPPSTFETIEEKVIIGKQTWLLQEIEFKTEKLSDSKYSCHIATNEQVKVQTCYFNTLDFIDGFKANNYVSNKRK